MASAKAKMSSKGNKSVRDKSSDKKADVPKSNFLFWFMVLSATFFVILSYAVYMIYNERSQLADDLGKCLRETVSGNIRDIEVYNITSSQAEVWVYVDYSVAPSESSVKWAAWIMWAFGRLFQKVYIRSTSLSLSLPKYSGQSNIGSLCLPDFYITIKPETTTDSIIKSTVSFNGTGPLFSLAADIIGGRVSDVTVFLRGGVSPKLGIIPLGSWSLEKEFPINTPILSPRDILGNKKIVELLAKFQ